jgi:hypothetical protein
MDETELTALCVEAIKQHPDEWACVYRDVLLDRISNAARLFAGISHAKHQNEPGVFVYSLTAREFIAVAINQEDAACEWVPLSQLPGNVQPGAEGLCARIKGKTETDFAILIFLHDDVGASSVSAAAAAAAARPKVIAMSAVISTDPSAIAERIARMQGGYASGVRRSRIAQRDVLASLLRCCTCRCSGASVGAPNPEYRWAKQYLGRMQRRGRKHNGGQARPKTSETTTDSSSNSQSLEPLHASDVTPVDGMHTFAAFLDTYVAPKLFVAPNAELAATLIISNEQGQGTALKCVKRDGTIAYAWSSDHEHWSPLESSLALDEGLRGGYGRGGSITLRIHLANEQFHLYHFMYQMERPPSRRGKGGATVATAPRMNVFKLSADQVRRNNTIDAQTGESLGEEPGVTYM